MIWWTGYQTLPIQLQNFIDSDYPFDKLRVKHNGKKVTGNLRREMDNLTGEQTALKYFAKSDRISRENFQTVWWDGMENLVKSYRQVYQVWLTKTHLRILWYTLIHVVLEAWMVSYVTFMRKCGQKNVTCDEMQRAKEEEDVAQFSWKISGLSI